MRPPAPKPQYISPGTANAGRGRRWAGRGAHQMAARLKAAGAPFLSGARAPPAWPAPPPCPLPSRSPSRHRHPSRLPCPGTAPSVHGRCLGQGPGVTHTHKRNSPSFFLAGERGTRRSASLSQPSLCSLFSLQARRLAHRFQKGALAPFLSLHPPLPFLLTPTRAHAPDERDERTFLSPDLFMRDFFCSFTRTKKNKRRPTQNFAAFFLTRPFGVRARACALCVPGDTKQN